MTEKLKGTRGRRPYHKLQLEQVQLVAEEAVLAKCKFVGGNGSGGADCKQADGTGNCQGMGT
jgi:hypothetical protein